MKGISWFGNSTMDGMAIFNTVTFNMSEVIDSVRIRYQNGEEINVQSGHFDSLDPQPRTIPNRKYGRCYEITIDNKHNLFYVQVVAKQQLDIFFNLPHQFYTNSRLRIFANTSENIYIPLTYEIQTTNHDPKCRKYSSSYAGSFDDCKAKDIEERLLSTLNCSVPFGLPTGKLCSDKESKNASDLYRSYYLSESPNCPR